MPGEKLIIREPVGMCRARKDDGVIDEGNDGTLWMPSKRIAALTDGITGSNGNGMHDLKLYRNLLETTEETKEAFFNLIGVGSGSTIVSIEFPETMRQRLRHLHAGDSLCLRLRNEVLEVVTLPEHTVWGDIEYELHRELQYLQSIEQASRIPIKRRRQYAKMLKKMLTKNGEGWLLRRVGDVSSPSGLLHVKLFSGNCLRLSTSDLHTPEKAKKFIGHGRMLTVMHGDRWVLCSDGVTDVLSLDEILHILMDCESSETAACALVSETKSPEKARIKNDDRAALVADVE